MTATLLFAQVPRFYAQAERARDPSLAGRPVIVGGDPRKKGLVQSATRDALECGVLEGMLVVEALSRCSGARARPTDMRAYRELSSRLRACFRRATDRIEPAGIDAAYLDTQELPESGEAVARGLRAAVRKTLDLPLRVGIGPVKFVAKLAADEAGDDELLRVPLAEVQRFLGPLPVGRLPGVGPRTASTLAELGARTVHELRALSRSTVEGALGNHGLTILEAAHGHGDARVRAAPHPRSVSQESTLEEPELDLAQLEERLLDLAGRAESGLALERLVARRVALKLRYHDGETIHRSRTLDHPVAGAREIGAVARDLLGHTQAGIRPVRLLGLAVSNLSRIHRDDRQLDLFG